MIATPGVGETSGRGGGSTCVLTDARRHRLPLGTHRHSRVPLREDGHRGGVRGDDGHADTRATTACIADSLLRSIPSGRGSTWCRRGRDRMTAGARPQADRRGSPTLLEPWVSQGRRPGNRLRSPGESPPAAGRGRRSGDITASARRPRPSSSFPSESYPATTTACALDRRLPGLARRCGRSRRTLEDSRPVGRKEGPMERPPAGRPHHEPAGPFRRHWRSRQAHPHRGRVDLEPPERAAGRCGGGGWRGPRRHRRGLGRPCSKAVPCRRRRSTGGFPPTKRPGTSSILGSALRLPPQTKVSCPNKRWSSCGRTSVSHTVPFGVEIGIPSTV
jgi:hypothetical protein